jgi:hypothetical protein
MIPRASPCTASSLARVLCRGYGPGIGGAFAPLSLTSPPDPSGPPQPRSTSCPARCRLPCAAGLVWLSSAPCSSARDSWPDRGDPASEQETTHRKSPGGSSPGDRRDNFGDRQRRHDRRAKPGEAPGTPNNDENWPQVPPWFPPPQTPPSSEAPPSKEEGSILRGRKPIRVDGPAAKRVGQGPLGPAESRFTRQPGPLRSYEAQSRRGPDRKDTDPDRKRLGPLRRYASPAATLSTFSSSFCLPRPPLRYGRGLAEPTPGPWKIAVRYRPNHRPSRRSSILGHPIDSISVTLHRRGGPGGETRRGLTEWTFLAIADKMSAFDRTGTFLGATR